MPFVALPIALSAFLLFVVQPMVARTILTAFGGSQSVWTACLLFFQAVLLAGYAFAHGLARLPRSARRAIHGGLLALAVLSVMFDPATNFHGEVPPLVGVLALLTTNVGLPFFALAVTSPLLQKITSERHRNGDPYRFTALSNAASLAGLLSYPFLVEPWVGLRVQRTAWAIGFSGFAIAMFVALGGSSPVRVESLDAPSARERPPAVFRWMMLAAGPSLLLAAATFEITREVATVPLLWTVPLALYLASFIVAFESKRLRSRPLEFALLVVAVLAFAYLRSARPTPPLFAQLAIVSLVLFLPALASHVELARLAPDARHLTRFHLAIAAGGVIGAGFAAIVAPLAFDQPRELAIAVASIAVALTWSARVDGESRVAPIACGCLAVIVVIAAESITDSRNVVFVARDFYGIHRIFHERLGDRSIDILCNGRTVHGAQLRDASGARELTLTTYYSEGSGSELAIRIERERLKRPLRIGAVGLGVGTIAACARTGDTIRFYELDPGLEAIVRERFTFLADSKAAIEVVRGDARVSLERELRSSGPRAFDVLVLDAFASDAVPLHLLTSEAFALYRRHLREDGVIAIHVTNRSLDLTSLARAQASAQRLESRVVVSRPDKAEPWRYDSSWVEIFARAETATSPEWKAATEDAPIVPRPPFTDDFCSLFSLLRPSH